MREQNAHLNTTCLMAESHAQINSMSLDCRACNQHSNVSLLRTCHVEQHHQEGYLLITKAMRKQFVQVCPETAPSVLLGLKRSPVLGALFEEQTQRKPSGKCCLLQQRSHVYAS